MVQPTASQLRRRSLVICVIVLAVAILSTAGESVRFQVVERDFNYACRHKNWTWAIELGHEMVEMVPERVVLQYNIACVYSLSGDAVTALFWLRKAANNGFCSLSHFDTDPDIDSVRDLTGFSIVRAKVAENRQERVAKLRGEAAGSPVLIVPPQKLNIDEPAPLIIAFHGYGDRAGNYPELWRGPAGQLGAIIAAPQGERRIGSGFAWGDVDKADAVLLETIEKVEELYSVDRDRIILTGFSQGGFIAMALGVRHPELFAGVIPIAGPYVPGIDAPTQVAGDFPKYYFIVGSRDRTAEEVRRAAEDFAAAGYEVELKVISGIGHTVPENGDRELAKALRFVLEP